MLTAIAALNDQWLFLRVLADFDSKYATIYEQEHSKSLFNNNNLLNLFSYISDLILTVLNTKHVQELELKSHLNLQIIGLNVLQKSHL